ncbi:MAG: S8 family serine peptidase [Clostridium sp.]|uniref:S8 family serine peptidase n=1 Tax=Clostridium sp. TaxID=1506 RepID=UPI002A766184|nr:S8 family serine peptidase [Clostridium sp.]MDY2631209.1 S8 family serine peptidase [Clostridium sp.]
MRKTKKRAVSIAILISMFLSLVVGTSSSVVKADNNINEVIIKEALLQQLNQKINKNDSFANVKKLEKNTENSSLNDELNPEEKIRVIVELEEEPATLQLEDGEQPEVELINKVKEAQKPIKDEVEDQIGEEVRHTYGNLINGFSIDVKRKDVEKIEDIDGVKKVSEAKVYYPDMSKAKEFIQSASVWQDYGYKGEGLVVSIIDTGIDYTHKDMKLTNNSKVKISKDDVNQEFGKYYTEKVPYGYNFADDDDKVIDTSGSMHGMHVAGIVGANASEDEVKNNQGIQGVAPEAQLLAMKVFSNNSEIKGAYSDDIIAAIEKSVELKADVINMSLGSSAGYRDDKDPEQVAIKNATDAGVICVVSAGNSTTSTAPYVIDGISDVGVLGSPAAARDAIQVASSENSVVTLPAFTAIINNTESVVGYTQTDVDPIDVFKENEELTLVDANLGKPEDFNGKNVQGKIALVKRGDISFVEKQLNAQNAGAKGVIIYNNAATTEYINMATDEAVKIPAIFINGNDGNTLKNSISNVKIKFNGKVSVIANAVNGEMSDFTSWGPTPDLEFAPQITGPGGNIFSTLNNNRYGSMSGTSMAAPNVSGATALILQGLKAQGINLQGRDLVEFVKKSIVNTAKPLTEENTYGDEVPYSPRRQGSGLIQTKNAINNRVLAYGSNNEPTISLKEIGETTEFEITLKNYSDEDKTYEVKSLGGVLTAFEPNMENQVITESMHFDTILEDATLNFSTNNVTVPAKGETKVKATLNVRKDSVTNNFVEGFISFESKDNKVPSLVVPYMGYYGDWSEETIIDGAIWEPNTVNMVGSFAASKLNGEYNYLGFMGKDNKGSIIIDPDKIAISPNGDEVFDSVIPALYLLRNAREVKVDLLDENKNLIKENISSENYLRKKIFASEGGNQQGIYSSLEWNGKVYNPATGNEEVAEEGTYYLKYKARVDGATKYQEFIMPVSVDITPVKTTLESSKESQDVNYELNISFNGELKNNNISAYLLYVNGKQVKDYNTNEDNLTASLDLLNNKINKIEIATMDKAGNSSTDVYEIGVGNYKPEVKLIDFPVGEALNTGELLVKGEYIGDVSEILINGETPDLMENGKFEKLLNLKEGYTTITVLAKASNDDVIFDKSYKVFNDTVAPEINISEPVILEDDTVVTAQDKVKIKGTISDNTEGYKLYINGENILSVALDGAKSAKDTEREFEYEVAVNNGDFITVRAEDLVNNETVKRFKVIVDKTIPEISVDNVENNKYYNTNIKPEVNVNPDTANITATLNGNPYNFEEITEDGNYVLEVVALGLNGVESKKTLNFTIDKVAPQINLQGIENNKKYNTNILPNLDIDEEATVVLELNGEAYNGENIVNEGSYTLKVKAIDKSGNESVAEYNFTIDKTAPEVDIDGILNGMKYNKEVSPLFASNEEVELTITLNDKPYNYEPITENGDYTIKIIAKDLAGNVTEVSKSFTIKLPELAVNKDNPTPVANPNGNSGRVNLGDRISDDNGTNNLDTSSIGKGNLPKTGNDGYYFVLISGIVIIGFGVLLLKRKTITR